MISKLEEANRLMRSSGLCDKWFGKSDAKVRGVASGANGPLFEALLKASGYVDRECTELLRKGSLHHSPGGGGGAHGFTCRRSKHDRQHRVQWHRCGRGL